MSDRCPLGYLFDVGKQLSSWLLFIGVGKQLSSWLLFVDVENQLSSWLLFVDIGNQLSSWLSAYVLPNVVLGVCVPFPFDGMDRKCN